MRTFGLVLVAALVVSATAAEAQVLCVELRGGKATRHDVKFRDGSTCKAGERELAVPSRDLPVSGPAGPQGPTGLAGPPGQDASALEYAVVSVFVEKVGGNGPTRYATFSVALGSPIGTTTGGNFRFTCQPAQAPCKISYGAAVISDQSGNALVHPRLLIHKEDSPGAPITFCEYADGANNNAGLDQIPRVPSLQDAVSAMQTPLNMGIGGTLDCGSTQTYPITGVVTEILVPAASNGSSTAFYDVAATFAFSPTVSLPPGE